MKKQEFTVILIAFILITFLISFQYILQNINLIFLSALFAAIILFLNISAKKITASLLDASVEIELWKFSQYHFKPHWRLKKPFPAGAFVPLIFLLISSGYIKALTFLTYDTSALKRRAAKRHGHYSFTEMTDFHNALIGASGILILLIISFITYWIPGLELLSKYSAYYTFWNLIPFSKLDGSQIFYGSRLIWTTLALISILFSFIALVFIQI